ncbi:glycosyltransferase [Patescibacteria group bacterium]|nr:glycosyltransferase [Patescibacteria group bacterium]
MRILSISIDRKVFEENSDVRQRLFDYGTLIDRLDVIILNKENEPFRKTKIGENVYLYPTNSRNSFFYIRDAIKVALKINSLIKENETKIDLVTAQDAYETGVIAWLISQKLKTKLELQIHTDLFNKYFIKHSFANRIRTMIARFLLNKADHIRVVSKRIKNSLPLEIQNKFITVIPIFSSTALVQVITPSFFLKEKYPQFKFIILMMSRLEEEKNIALAISAMKEVVRVFPKTGLVIVGSGSKRNSLRKLARRKGLEQNIIFNSWTDDPISYYKTADLFLSTSNYEGYGLSLVEAILSHCPILTTNVGIVGEILSGNNALLCDVGDGKCLTQSLINAQQHPELLEELKEKAYNDFLRKVPQTKNESLNMMKDAWLKTIKESKVYKV